MLAPSLTRIIKTLEERELISRRRGTGDGRNILLAITPGGLAFIRELVPETEKAYGYLERRLGRQRIEHLLDILGDFSH